MVQLAAMASVIVIGYLWNRDMIKIPSFDIGLSSNGFKFQFNKETPAPAPITNYIYENNIQGYGQQNVQVNGVGAGAMVHQPPEQPQLDGVQDTIGLKGYWNQVAPAKLQIGGNAVAKPMDHSSSGGDADDQYRYGAGRPYPGYPRSPAPA